MEGQVEDAGVVAVGAQDPAPAKRVGRRLCCIDGAATSRGKGQMEVSVWLQLTRADAVGTRTQRGGTFT